MQKARLPITRRVLLQSGSAAVAATALPGPVRAQGAPYRRWEITDPQMPPQILNSYANGIQAMLRLGPNDPRNWYRNALVHVFDCPHGNWWFLPWHRGYLGWFEQTIRSLSGDPQFALPYWDWTKTPRVPDLLYQGVLSPDNSAYAATYADFAGFLNNAVNQFWAGLSPKQTNVLQERGYNSPTDLWNQAQAMFVPQPNSRGLKQGQSFDGPTRAAVSINTIEAALRTPAFTGTAPARSFGSFRSSDHNFPGGKGILESQPHDNVHGMISGMMGAFLSPVDPVFFLHHANLDRLWDVWTRRQMALNRPILPTGSDFPGWANEQFLFFSDANGRPVLQTSAGDYTSTAPFGYDYSPGSGEEMVPSAQTMAFTPEAAQPVARGQVHALSVASSTSAAAAEVPAAALRPASAQAPVPTTQITIDLQPTDVGRRFQVLVSTGTGAPPIDAGAITVFEHHPHGPTTFSVPLPPSVASTAASAGNVPLEVRVVPQREPANPLRSHALSTLAIAPQPAPPITAVSLVTG